MGQRKEIHDRVLNAASTEELMDVYSDWADHYDKDLIDEMGYAAPAIASKLLLDHLDAPGARILDAGCGTGLVGELLQREGYRNLEGIDYSPQMLEKAREKNIYQALIQADLTASLDIPDDRFDAVISVGTFTCGHVGPEAFDELVRITAPGGYICFTVREQAWGEDGYRRKTDEIEARGDWQAARELTTEYIRQEGSSCKVCLYRIAP